jgi:hypothetical protein
MISLGRTFVAIAGVAIVLPVSAVFALAKLPDMAKPEEAGLCTDLGCVGGNTKCADGNITLPNGSTATYTCYTKQPTGET